MNEYSYLEWSHVSLHTHLYDITARLACTHTYTHRHTQKQTQTQKDITLYTLYHCEWQLPLSTPQTSSQALQLPFYKSYTHTHAYAQVVTIATLSHWSCIQLSRTRGPHGMTDHITAFTFFNGPAGHKRAGGGR